MIKGNDREYHIEAQMAGPNRLRHDVVLPLLTPQHLISFRLLLMLKICYSQHIFPPRNNHEAGVLPRRGLSCRGARTSTHSAIERLLLCSSYEHQQLHSRTANSHKSARVRPINSLRRFESQHRRFPSVSLSHNRQFRQSRSCRDVSTCSGKAGSREASCLQYSI